MIQYGTLAWLAFTVPNDNPNVMTRILLPPPVNRSKGSTRAN